MSQEQNYPQAKCGQAAASQTEGELAKLMAVGPEAELVEDLDVAAEAMTQSPESAEASEQVNATVDRPAWMLSDERWDCLEPAGFYAQGLRGALLTVMSWAMVPFALPFLVTVVGMNWILFGDRRKIFYTQDRVGRRGVIFQIYKFRTMSEPRPGKSTDQQRVTRFGRLLRNTHLDELPQLWNILRGDMCLIGPRPEMVSIEAWAAEAVPGFNERLVLTPGLTGWAQVSQGYTEQEQESYQAKLVANRDYIEQLSFATDVRVLWRTVLRVLGAKGWR